MATSAAGGGPGPGPKGAFVSLQSVAKPPMIALAVVGAAAGVYAFWELRVRASRKLGLIPKSLDKDWQEAEHERMRHMPFQSNPSKFAYLNPHTHNIPPSRAIVLE